MALTEKQMQRLFNKAIREYGLIEDGDHILIGLSGGKDSMALLQLLGRRSKILKPRFTVEAAFIRMTNIPYQNDETYLNAFAEQNQVPLHIVETSFDASTDHRHTHCFLCSWTRRKALFQLSKQLNCNKIALGHNKDDLIQTALMNMTFEGRFETMSPKMLMDKFPMTIIRPLCLIREADLQDYADEQHFLKQIKNCPFEDASHRHDMKDIIRRLEQMNPEFNFSIFRALKIK